jgi:hypothetical protein
MERAKSRSTIDKRTLTDLNGEERDSIPRQQE